MAGFYSEIVGQFTNVYEKVQQRGIFVKTATSVHSR